MDAFFAAVRLGDFDPLVAVLHPDVVLRADAGPTPPGTTRVIRSVAAVARSARLGAGAHTAATLRPALVNGDAGVIMMEGGQPFAVWGFTVAAGRILEIVAATNPERLRRLGVC